MMAAENDGDKGDDQKPQARPEARENDARGGFAGLGATHTTIHERTWLPFMPERCAAARRRSRESPTITD